MQIHCPVNVSCTNMWSFFRADIEKRISSSSESKKEDDTCDLGEAIKAVVLPGHWAAIPTLLASFEATHQDFLKEHASGAASLKNANQRLPFDVVLYIIASISPFYRHLLPFAPYKTVKITNEQEIADLHHQLAVANAEADAARAAFAAEKKHTEAMEVELKACKDKESRRQADAVCVQQRLDKAVDQVREMAGREQDLKRQLVETKASYEERLDDCFKQRNVARKVLKRKSVELDGAQKIMSEDAQTIKKLKRYVKEDAETIEALKAANMSLANQARNLGESLQLMVAQVGMPVFFFYLSVHQVFLFAAFMQQQPQQFVQGPMFMQQ